MSKQIDFKAEANSIYESMVAARRDFHRYPELGFKEYRTAGLIAERLGELGFEVQHGVGQTGVVGVLPGKKERPVILLRFDMDALPVTEANDVPYISSNPGVMHACGHDGHMAMGLGLAEILSAHREELNGTFKFVFQPAEEGLGGAFAMIADGVLENPRPDVAFAMHLWNPLPLGTVQVTHGPAMSASSIFTLTIRGKGGHGAAPHHAVDPILATGHIITAIQSIVSRNVDPQESVVISLGQVEGGTTYNVIPDAVVVKGTVRSYGNDIHRILYRRILEMAQNIAKAFNCTASLETVAIVPAVVNDPAAVQFVEQAALKHVGRENILNKREMASEDMGYLLEEVPGCYFFVGAGNEETGCIYPHHHPNFNFDERAMITGVATMGEAVLNYLRSDRPET